MEADVLLKPQPLEFPRRHDALDLREQLALLHAHVVAKEVAEGGAAKHYQPGQLGNEEDARRAGADECLLKPFDEAAIFDSIRKHLRLFPRDEERAPAGWSVTFWRDGVQHGGTLRDLSRGGFFIRTAVRQPVGARLEISFDVPGDTPGRTVAAEALVVRMGLEPDRGLGTVDSRQSTVDRSEGRTQETGLPRSTRSMPACFATARDFSSR